MMKYLWFWSYMYGQSILGSWKPKVSRKFDLHYICNVLVTERFSVSIILVPQTSQCIGSEKKNISVLTGNIYTAVNFKSLVSINRLSHNPALLNCTYVYLEIIILHVCGWHMNEHVVITVCMHPYTVHMYVCLVQFVIFLVSTLTWKLCYCMHWLRLKSSIILCLFDFFYIYVTGKN